MEWGVLHATRGWVDPSRIANPGRARGSSDGCARAGAERGLAATYRVFLLSPADCSGKRARLLQKPDPGHDLARRLHGRRGRAARRGVQLRQQPLLPRASSPTRGPSPGLRAAAPAVHVITPCDGLRAAGVAAARPPTCAGTPACRVDPDEERYRRPLAPRPRGARAGLGRGRGRAARQHRLAQVRRAADVGARASASLFPVGLRGPRRHEPRRPDAALRATRGASSATSRSSAPCATGRGRRGCLPRRRRLRGRLGAMRIATWNVNSLKARLEKVRWWLERARPDVLLMQETKLADADAPVDGLPRRRLRARPPRRGALERRRHRQPRAASPTWSRTSASRCARRDADDAGDDEPLAEARMIAADVRRRARRQPLRAERARRSTRRSTRPSSPGSSGSRAGSPSARRSRRAARARRRLQRRARRTPTSGTRAPATAAPTSRRREREAFARLCRWGLVDAYRLHHPEPGRYTWWDYRAGNFHKNFGMRIDHLLVTRAARRAHACGRRSTARRARASRSPPTTRRCSSTSTSRAIRFDAGWASAEGRIAARPRAAR